MASTRQGGDFEPISEVGLEQLMNRADYFLDVFMIITLFTISLFHRESFRTEISLLYPYTHLVEMRAVLCLLNFPCQVIHTLSAAEVKGPHLRFAASHPRVRCRDEQCCPHAGRICFMCLIVLPSSLASFQAVENPSATFPSIPHMVLTLWMSLSLGAS